MTLWLVVGAAGVTAGAFWAFPEIRKPLALALFLANPMLVEAVLLGQLPFLWATAFWFVAIGMWRRERLPWAVVFAALAQASHPAVLLPLAGLTVLVRLPFDANWRRLFIAYSLSVLLAVPAIALVFISPVVEDSTFVSLMGNFFGTISLRAFVVYAPFEIILLVRLFPRRTLFVAFAAVLSLNVVLVPIRHTGYAWHALTRSPDTTLLAFVDSSVFDKGATYRVLRVADGKVGMYQLLQHGARLDSEFFPESIDRRSWPAAPDYRDFLDRRDVDYVLIYRAYDARYHTNEHALLDELVHGAVRLAGPLRARLRRLPHRSHVPLTAIIDIVHCTLDNRFTWPVPPTADRSAFSPSTTIPKSCRSSSVASSDAATRSSPAAMASRR